MTTARDIVQAYFNAWTSNDIDTAYGLLARDLHFAGPTAGYDSAEAFRPALVAFAKMTKSARIIELVAEGDRVAMLYDCELPAPVGTIQIASFFRVEGERIKWYETQFDATELRKILPKR